MKLLLRLKDFHFQRYESGTQEPIGPSCEMTASKLKYFISGRKSRRCKRVAHIATFSFSRYPNFGTIGEGWNVDWPVNWELCLSAQLPNHQDGLVHRLFYCCNRIELLAISRSILPSLVNNTSRYLNFFAWGRHSVPTWRKQSTGFRQSTMASELEVLTLILTACRRSRSEDANRTTSSANSREAIPRPPNLTCSTSRLHLDILSMKITNRTSDKGQPWRRPTPTGIVSDLMPRMRTQLLLQAYRDRIARSNESGAPYSRSIPHNNLWRDSVESLLQVHKAHVDWLGKLPGPLEYSVGVNSWSTVPRPGQNLHCWSWIWSLTHGWEPPFQHPGINFSWEDEECDTTIARAHFPVPLFENGNHHPGLPVEGHCSWPPCDIEEAYQPRQPNNFQHLQHIRAPFPGPSYRLQEGRILWTAVWRISKNHSQNLTPRNHREATVSFSGENSNTAALSWGFVSIPSPACNLTLGNSRKEQSPTLLQELGSRASAVRGGKPNNIYLVLLGCSTSRTSSGSFPASEVTFHVPRASLCCWRSARQSPCPACRLVFIAPDPDACPCGWWV